MWTGVREKLSAVSKERHRARKKLSSGKFIRGPLPLSWITTASSLSAAALRVGLAAWLVAGYRAGQQAALCNTVLAQFGVDRVAGYRALRELEQAGLVQVERHKGRCPRIKIVHQKQTGGAL